MAEKEMYLVSFGNSSKYVTTKGETIESVYDKLKDGMHKLFPSMNTDKIPEPTVEKITDAARYKDYPELDLKAIPDILKSLATGHESAADVKELNNDAPWSKINPFGK